MADALVKHRLQTIRINSPAPARSHQGSRRRNENGTSTSASSGMVLSAPGPDTVSVGIADNSLAWRMEEPLLQTPRVTVINVSRDMCGRRRRRRGDLLARRRKKGRKRGHLEVSHMDSHHLDTFDDACTMERFVHATAPAKVLAGFRVLKPGSKPYPSTDSRGA
ncbi:hypothetical protein F4823DRAFT_567689 [Ustulina deusta]|nr:hypothetical protein F4823DRAFT_567689 [Ustulina deusta]